MEDLKKRVLMCNKCEKLIHCADVNMIPAIMNHPKARILFIATNPGVPLDNEKGKEYEEVLINSRQGKMFVSKFLELLNLKYEDIVWSNVCKCASPNNRIITYEEMLNCFSILQQQADELENLEVVIILGSIARGFFIENKLKLKENIKIIEFFHPSYIFRTNNYKLINKLAEETKKCLK